MPATEPAWIALGSNLGDRARYLAMGRAGLAGCPGVRVVAVTAVLETAPIGPTGQQPYLNQMALVRTGLEPAVLLDALQAIEDRAGRVRDQRWGPRTLDLDIVRFGDREVSSARLTIPHPEIPRRPFWSSQMEELRPYAG